MRWCVLLAMGACASQANDVDADLKGLPGQWNGTMKSTQRGMTVSMSDTARVCVTTVDAVQTEAVPPDWRDVPEEYWQVEVTLYGDPTTNLTGSTLTVPPEGEDLDLVGAGVNIARYTNATETSADQESWQSEAGFVEIFEHQPGDFVTGSLLATLNEFPGGASVGNIRVDFHVGRCLDPQPGR